MQDQNSTAAAQDLVTTRSTGVRYGMILGAVSILYFLILSVADIDMTQGFWRWFGVIFMIAAMFLAHAYYKQNGTGYMAYSDGVKISLWLGLVSSILSGIFQYIYVKFIDGSMLDMIREQATQDMEARGMSEEQIEQGMKFASFFMSPEFILIGGLLGGIFFAVIIGLIVSIFTQKNPPETAI